MQDRYLHLLSEKFPNRNAVNTEIINLKAILSLPKGTEHFVSDLHGASSAFIHMIKNASGVLRRKVDDIYGDTLTEQEKRALCALIYYPDERLELIQNGTISLSDEIQLTDSPVHQFTDSPVHQFTLTACNLQPATCNLQPATCNLNIWYHRRLEQVTAVARAVTVKYSRSKVRKLLPKNFAYVIEELLHESSIEHRGHYFKAIIDGIIETGSANDLLIQMCYFIHILAIDTLHVVGDIFDRGPGADKIMEVLSTVHDYDIQWGNHDILWMGAAAGNRALIATVLRVSIRYANIETLEEGYGINLLPLANFAMETYSDDPCTIWQTRDFENNPRLTRSAQLMAKMHKAASVLQFKLEGQTILRHPEWQMTDRLLLDKINFTNGTISLYNKVYPIRDTHLPTIDPTNPYQLSQEEEELMTQLERSFRKSEKMQRHLRLLYQHGSLFKVCNGFLLYHAAVPMNEDGTFTSVNVCGQEVSGRALMQRIDDVIRQAYYAQGKTQSDALDYMLYLWCGPQSPLYNKDRMTTFERYFIGDKTLEQEQKGAYYTLANNEHTCRTILHEFGLNPDTGRIINGHIPVKTLKGESPMRASGKRFVIDGGFSKPYQEKTGIAGYTLIYNSHGIQLVEHEEFESRQQAVLSGSDIHSRTLLQDFSDRRILIRDTDLGQELLQQVTDLEQLRLAYETGEIKER